MDCYTMTTFVIEEETGKNKRKKNPLSPPVLNESKPLAQDEFSIRCEDERSGSVFFGFILAGNQC